MEHLQSSISLKTQQRTVCIILMLIEADTLV